MDRNIPKVDDSGLGISPSLLQLLALLLADLLAHLGQSILVEVFVLLFGVTLVAVAFESGEKGCCLVVESLVLIARVLVAVLCHGRLNNLLHHSLHHRLCLLLVGLLSLLGLLLLDRGNDLFDDNGLLLLSLLRLLGLLFRDYRYLLGNFCDYGGLFSLLWLLGLLLGLLDYLNDLGCVGDDILFFGNFGSLGLLSLLGLGSFDGRRLLVVRKEIGGLLARGLRSCLGGSDIV